MDLLDFEPVPDVEDAMEALFDPMDLLEGIELGEFDFSASSFEPNLENSDSDSGISVSCENVLGRTPDSATSTTPTSTSKPSTPDFVLTDAVYSSIAPPSSAEQTTLIETPCPKPLPVISGISNKPVRVFKLSCNRSSGRPAFITPVESSVQTPTTLPTICRVTSAATSNRHILTNPAQSFAPSVIIQSKNQTLQNTMASNMPKVSANQFLQVVKPDPEIAASITQSQFGSFLDDYDPTLNPDSVLEDHLRDIYGHQSSASASSSHNGGFPLGPATPSYMSSPELIGSGDCLLTHASLERLRKKQERMIKNRHAASMSRLRKKEYLERLEMRYAQLKRENVSLWRQNEEWRVRCNELERNLSELQSQMNGVTCAAEVSPSLSSPSPPETILSVTQPSLIRQSVSLGQSSSVAASSFLPTHQNVSTRSRLTTLSLGAPKATDSNPLKRLNGLESGLSTGLINHSGPTGNRKTVLNSLFYSGKNSSLSQSDGQSSAKLHRPSLSGVISRSAGSRFQSNRGKLIATTSLLSIFCLFSLNIFLSPLGGPGFVNDQVKYGSDWSAPSYGQRVLLSLPESDPSADGCDDSEQSVTSQNGTRCGPIDTKQNDIDRIWQLWVEQNKDNYTNLSRVPLTWTSGRLRYVSQPWPGKNRALPTDKTTKRMFSDQRRSRSPGSSTEQLVDSQSSPKSENRSSPLVVRTTPQDLKRPLSRRLPSPDRPDVLPQQGLQSPSSERPFYRQFVWYQEDLLEAAGRRNDTVYFILSKIDAIHVLDPVGDLPTKKITLIVPAYPSKNSSHFASSSNEPDPRLIMLQVDCELRNVTFIHPPERASDSPRN